MTKILLISTAPSVRNALNYLFTVILKFDFECIDFDACEHWLHNNENVNAIFVDMTEANSNPAPLINKLTTHAQL
ncbi:MAG TPA: DNA-binding response regulator, partial [Sulfitobacter sp.]|nr:DNA-binding response regulator [Sulfitobacter sp.]